MTKFNSNLNNLFKNYKQQQKYAQKAYDVNKDGKINKNDKKELENKEKDILKKSNLFDVNGDGKFNQKDIDMFIKGDVDGDGKVSKTEETFVKEYKADLVNFFKKEKNLSRLMGKNIKTENFSRGQQRQEQHIKTVFFNIQ